MSDQRMGMVAMMEPTDLADLLYATGRLMWQLTLSGTPTAHQTAAFEWMQRINRGHMVIELSSWSAPAIERVGTVLELDGDSVQILCLDGTRKWWSNAQFVRIPRDQGERKGVAGHETGAAVLMVAELVRKSDDNPDLSRGGSVAAFLDAFAAHLKETNAAR